MVVGKIKVSFFVISWIIIHLGMNPVRGGSPPRDSNVVRVRAVIRGILFHMWDRDRVVVVAIVIRSINIVIVIMI